MEKSGNFQSDYEMLAWMMFKNSGNPLLAQEMIAERFAEKDLEK